MNEWISPVEVAELPLDDAAQSDQQTACHSRQQLRALYFEQEQQAAPEPPEQ